MGYVKMMMSETKFLKSHYQSFAVLRDFEVYTVFYTCLVGCLKLILMLCDAIIVTFAQTTNK